MKIVFLVNHDLPALLALNLLLPKLGQHQNHVFFTQKERNVASMPKAIACLANFDAKLIARAERLTSFEDLGALQANDINGQDFDTLQSLQPDLIISIRHMTILQTKCIELAKFGVINLHSGKLPGYQGVMASFWAMLDQQEELGTTLHWIEDSTIDTGQIISSSTTQADYQKSYLWNVLNLYPNGCANILACIDSLSQGENINGRAQEGAAQYFSYPTQTDIDKAQFRLFSSSDNADSFI